MSTVKGDLASIGVPEIFRAIASEDRTGRLVLVRGEAEAHVFFRHGDAYHARLLSSGVRLGERLVSAGMLSHDELAETLELQRNDNRGLRLGQLLIERGLVDTEGLAGIVRQQIEDTIFELLRWDGGTFEFEPETESDEDIGLHVSVENLVMEGARRFREWHQITRKVPSMDAVPRLNDDDDAGIEVALTPEEWALISRVNGRATVAELGTACGFTDLEAARCVYGLLTTGVLKITLPEGVEAPPDDPALEEMFDELERALQESARDRRAEGVTHPTLEELVGTPASTAAIEEASAELPGFDELPIIADEERFGRVAEGAAEVLIEDDHPVIDPVIAVEDEPAAADVPTPDVEVEVPVETYTSSGSVVDEDQPPAWYDETAQAVDLPNASEQTSQRWVVETSGTPAWYDEPTVNEAPIAGADAAEPETQPVGHLEPAPVDVEPDLQVYQPVDLPPPAEEIVHPMDGPDERAGEPSAADWGDLQPSGPAPEPVLQAEEQAATVLVDEPVATVLVDEPVRPADGMNGYARMFSEISMAVDQEASPQTAEEPEPEPAEPAEEPERINATKRPVDPSVDTTALLREFSGLTDEVGENAPGMGTFEPISRTPASATDEKRGLFGKKKR